MNTKTLISFLAFAVILITAYLTISSFYEESQEKSYSITAFAPPVSLNHIKSSRPRFANATSSYQLEGVNMQAQSPSAALHAPSFRSGIDAVGRNISHHIPTNQRTVGSLQPGFYASTGVGVTRKPLPRASGGGFSSSLSLGLSGRTSNKESAAASSSMAFKGSKFSAAPSYEPFSGGGPGTPDPGGSIDDSGDDDIVFIPVPDGLPFLILLSFLYAIFKLIKVRKSLLSSTTKTFFAKYLHLPFIKYGFE